MRVIIDGKVKRAPRKGLKMKQIPPKKKKNITKATNQSIEETISFVVNGHLTPKKLTKKRMTLISKNDISETTAAVKNNRESRKPITTIKTKRANVKVKTLKGAPRKQVKRSTPESTTTSLSELKIATSAILAQTIENDSSEKQVKKGIKLKQSTKTKTECRNVKKQAKKNIPILRNSLKSEENEKKSKDKKSKIIIQKVKKLPAVKVKASVTIKQKGKVGKLKQTVNVKPKKSAVSSHEPKQVKQDVKPITTKLPKNNPITEEALCPKLELIEKKPRKLNKKKIKVEYTSADETSSTSDEFTLDALRQHRSNESAIKSVSSKKIGGKAMETNKKKTQKVKMLAKSPLKSKMTLIKKGAVANKKTCAKRKVEQRNRKLKLYSFWNGPKRHRVASLNALAKVHCLYENETRGTLMDNDHSIKSELIDDTNNDEEDDEILPTRTLRSAPGLRGAGKHWEMHDDTFSSSEDNENSFERPPSPKPKVEKEKKKPSVKRRRNRCELIMDLKDMVVRKRMASLNASAILAASYSVEKRSSKSPKSEVTDTESDDSEDSFSRPSEGNKKKCFDEDVKKEEDRKVIEVQAAPNKKVSVILNQDTDVTITGVYVNSTTRSTHHEGYCSIAGMQYRISAKSHTQTASTTVATETILQSAANMGQENNTTENAQQSCKSYTPLSALSSMQPPGTPNQHGVPQHVNSQHVIPLPTSQHTPHTSPVGRHHGCTSAFSAPPPGPYGPPPPPPPAHHTSSSAPPGDPNYIHGYYQPAGPLINVPQHGHPQSTSLGKTAPLSEVSSSPTPPPSHQTHSQSSTTDSLDSDVIITSATTAKEAIPPQHPPPPPPPTYRYSQYHPPHPGYAYGYPPQYYPSPHHPASYHHDLCYPNPYLHHKPYPPPTYRRHLTAPAGTQYYQANPPDIYHPPPPAPTQQNQQVVTANPPSSSTYQSAPSGPPPLLESYPPPPTLVEPYPPPPHYYPGYGPAPPPACYTHSPPSRTLPYLNAAYQSCPCPMQSCPKNVHTGPLTGDSKRSSHISSIAKDSLPLPPVALALPLEPVSATGPPSPARGSAGMPPPPSPAGATYQPPPPAPKQEELESVDCKPIEKRRKARVGKNMVRNNIAANFPENTMLLMCHQPTQASMCVTNVKREIESPEGKVCVSEEALKSKVEPPEIRLPSETIEETACVKNEKIAPCLKTEVSTKEEKAPLELEEEKKVSVDQLPCQKTVAENVKVKNMKRKLSILNEKPDVASPPPQKKQKLDKVMKANGSYKDLIKKNVPSIKINNGKRKLNIDAVIRPMLIKNSKLKIRKSSVKRKLSPSKDKLHSKRAKLSRPLIASNLHNSKQNLKTLKGKCSAAFDLSENKEPAQKTTLKKLQVNSKNSISEKKLAPEILDHLFAKNNVDRTIDCVVNRYSEILRTSKRSEASKIDDQSRKLKINNNPECVVKSTNVNNNNSASLKSKVVTPKKVGASKRKCKRKSVEVPVQVLPKVPRRQLQVPKWSNGWTWKGEPYQAKVFLNSDETVVVRKCYPAMMHAEGDTIEPKDCVLLKAGPRRNDLPFVAKVATLWENPDDGEMMMSLLWYYRPEHTEQGRQDYDESDEVFASRHKDTNSVACIEDKCFVLTFNEYCRYRKSLRRIEEGMEDTSTCIPNPEPYPRSHRQPPSTCLTSYDLIFFCRRVYDFRQKRIVKNPS